MLWRCLGVVLEGPTLSRGLRRGAWNIRLPQFKSLIDKTGRLLTGRSAIIWLADRAPALLFHPEFNETNEARVRRLKLPQVRSTNHLSDDRINNAPEHRKATVSFTSLQIVA